MSQKCIIVADGTDKRRKRIVNTLKAIESVTVYEARNGMELLQKIESNGNPHHLFISTSMPIINFRDYISLYGDTCKGHLTLVYDQEREITSLPNQINDTLHSDFTDDELLTLVNESVTKPAVPDTPKPRVIFVDDEKQVLTSLKRSFRHRDYILEFFTDGEEAIKSIQKNECSVIVSDMRMPKMDGVQLLQKVEEISPNTIRLVLSGHSDEQTIISAINNGHIWRYITKPWDENDIHIAVQNAVELYGERTQRQIVQNENRRLKKEISSQSNNFLIGSSPKMQNLSRMLEKLARLDTISLITGESGTGKELIASTLHYHGVRKSEPFIVVDCASLNSSVIESELFGYKKGAFTGALQNKVGLIEQAGNGTLFLDEIGELPLELQGRLLRVIQEKKIRPIGSNDYISTNARIIAATNRDLPSEIKNGNFREDLYYRLNVINIYSPPLRERISDIPTLIEHFLTIHCNEIVGYKEFSKEAVEKMCLHSWPGNVRELENIVIRTISLSDNEIIECDDINISNNQTPNSESEPLQSLTTLEDFEIHAIKKALEIADGNRRKAAEIVGIGEATLYRKLKGYQLV